MTIALVIVFATIMLMDAVWLTLNRVYHSNLIESVQGSPIKLRIIPAILTYILLATAITYFAVYESKSVKESAINGALIGTSMYGLYDLTNLSTLKGWTYEMAIKDTLWGTIVCSTSAAVAQWSKHILRV